MGAVGSRFSGGAVASSDTGRSGGDYTAGNGAVWAQGLYNKAKLDKAQGFDTDSYGFAMGFEATPTDSIKVGVGYAYTNTDVDGYLRSTDADINTGFIYSEYRPNKFFVNGVLSYGFGSYEEEKSVSSVLVKSKYDVDTFGAQIMAGYDMGIFTPEGGMRYISAKQDSYTDTANQRVSENTSDTVTGVVGGKVAQAYTLDSGTVLTPEFKLAATYDFITDEANSVVTLSNGASYTTAGENLDEFALEVGAGLTVASQGKGEIALNYEGKFREDYQDHTGMINFKYNF